MNKLLSWFEKNLVPVMEKIARNKWVIVLKDSVMNTLPLTLLASVCCIFTLIPEIFSISWWPDFWVPYGWTLGLIGLFMAFLVPFNYMEKVKLKKQRLCAGMIGVSCYFIICNPSVIEEGTIGLSQSVFGAGGMLVAMISGIYVSIIMEKFGKFSFFKEDSAMPDFVRSWFDLMLPAAICIFSVWIIIDFLNIDVFGIIQNIFNPVANFIQTPYGLVVMCFIYALNYSMGISNWVLTPVFSPLMTIAITSNIEMVANGTATVDNLYLVTGPALYSCYLYFGGEGGTLALNLMGLRSKSKKISSLCKAALVPSIFNINEPIVFGLIAWNPYLMLPMWIYGIIGPLVMWFFTKVIAFAPIPTIVFDLWFCPFPISTFICTQSIRAVILALIMFALSWAIYYPFYKMYEKAELEKEETSLKAKA
jgi:PTS system cellobiose-specific IIC component